MKIKETELAKFAISYMAEQGYEIYSEVQLDQYGPVADIVGKMGSVVWVVECKTAAGIAVMEQAYNWIYKANIVSICTPKVFVPFAQKWLEHLGIGAMYPTKYGSITEYIHPKLNRKATAFKGKLSEEQKTFAEAGTNSHHHYTPFKRTCRDVLQYVKFHDGCTMKDLLKNVQTHYSCPAVARQCLVKWLCEEKIAGVKINNGKLYLREIENGNK
jgi:hypothetical protein